MGNNSLHAEELYHDGAYRPCRECVCVCVCTLDHSEWQYFQLDVNEIGTIIWAKVFFSFLTLVSYLRPNPTITDRFFNHRRRGSTLGGYQTWGVRGQSPTTWTMSGKIVNRKREVDEKNTRPSRSDIHLKIPSTNESKAINTLTLLRFSFSLKTNTS